jgi:uncharacterized protein (TIGR01777 family)
LRSVFNKESIFGVSATELFAFHEREGAFELLNPPGSNVEVQSTASTLAPSNDVVRFTVRFGFLRFEFEFVHTDYEPGRMFADQQRKGLFTSWRHEHRFYEAGWDRATASRLHDRIEIAHPLLFAFVPFVKRQLKGQFAFRHRVTGEALSGEDKTTDEVAGKRVAVTGATGLIGRRVAEVLGEQGAEVVALVRDRDRASALLGDGVTLAEWDFTRPDQGDWRSQLARADAVIHLAGTPLFAKRWNAAFKREMEQSRIESTRQLVDAILAAERKPAAFVSASALGIYGTDPRRVVDESSVAADDLLARICVGWEDEARRLDDAGVRTAQIRIGIVLSTESGALKEMLPIFKLGVGGPMGHADRWINWIHLEDTARIIAMAAFHPEASGPINAVAPNPVPMKGLAKGIGKVLRRPTIMRYPPGLMKLIIGEAGEYSSGGPRALSDKVQSLGYTFFFTELEPALENLLKG